jgi:integrase
VLYHIKRKEALKKVPKGTLDGELRQLERAVEFFGVAKPLSAIDVTLVQEWAEDLREKHKGRRGNTVLSDGTVRHHLNALSSLYKRARAEKKVPSGYNPVGDWTENKPKGRAEEAKWLEIHEAALLLEAAKLYKPERSVAALADLHAIVATFLLTGGRFAEVMGLARTDVNFDRGTVTFRVHPWRRLKTKTSSRVVPLFPQLEQILRAYFAGSNAPTGLLLFPSLHRRVRGGDELMLGDIRKALDTVAIQAGWAAGEIRSKMFRHTYCSARLQTLDRGSPIGIDTVRRELGHSDASLVQHVYGHLGNIRHRAEFVEYQRATVEQISDVKIRRDFENRFKKVTHALKLVAA